MENVWKIQKCHKTMNIPNDIARFGEPKNYDAAPLELSLWYWAKLPARAKLPAKTSQPTCDEKLPILE